VFIYEFEGKRPQIHPEAFVAPTATLIGDVVVEAGASVWYGAVLRGDDCSIVVREGANIQDNAVLHAGPGETLEIGAYATIAHAVVAHGKSVGERALVANGTVLLDGVVIGAGSLVAAGSVVTPGTEIPEGMLASGTPAKAVKEIAGTGAAIWVELNPQYYPGLAQRHKAGVKPVAPTSD
jgi:carbonic anhydrase/acetyltransferase-like protein (isoleucine patch superfamily)